MATLNECSETYCFLVRFLAPDWTWSSLTSNICLISLNDALGLKDLSEKILVVKHLHSPSVM